MRYILKISKSNFENHFHHFDYVNHVDVWLPHKLSVKEKCGTMFLCAIWYWPKAFHLKSRKILQGWKVYIVVQQWTKTCGAG